VQTALHVDLGALVQTAGLSLQDSEVTRTNVSTGRDRFAAFADLAGRPESEWASNAADSLRPACPALPARRIL
jgi:hypothetical protein